MKNEQFQEALSDVREDLILDARESTGITKNNPAARAGEGQIAGKQTTKTQIVEKQLAKTQTAGKQKIIGILAAAACLIFAAGGAILVGKTILSDKESTVPPAASTTAAPLTPGTEIGGAPGEKKREKRWDEKTDAEKWAYLTRGSVEYVITGSISGDAVGEMLERTDMYGVDPYNEYARMNTDGEILAIPGIDPDVAVAGRFEDSGMYYVYVSRDPFIKNVGDFLQKAALRENLTVGCFTLIDRESKTGWPSKTTGTGIDRAMLLDLFSDGTVAEEAYKDRAEYPPAANIAVSLPVLNLNNLALWITEDGFVCTNLLGCQKLLAFRVGTEKTEPFLKYLETLEVIEPEMPEVIKSVAE